MTKRYRIRSKHKFADNRIPKFYSLCFKLDGAVWKFLSYDSDPNPSVPHGHYKNFKLDVYNGKIYRRGKIAGILKKKDLSKLWSDPNFLNVVVTAREYHAKNPLANLPELPTNKLKNKHKLINQSKEDYDGNSKEFKIYLEFYYR